MGRRRQGAVLYIFMNGEKVGHLFRPPAGGLGFQYDSNWLTHSLGRPMSLSMPLREQPYSGDIVENFFDNLLPDSQSIRNRIQREFGAKSTGGFDLLWHVGGDCVGALQLLPDDIRTDVMSIRAEPLDESAIAETLKSCVSLPMGMSRDKEFRISVAGAQEKTAFLKLRGQWHLPLAATPTSHIFKLPIGRIEHSNMDLGDSVENEWLCHAIFRAYGLAAAKSEIMSFKGTKALVVERFDRRWSTDKSWLIRLPMEDMCQALNAPSALKYESDGGPGIEQIMGLLIGSDKSLEDRKTFMTRVFLFWVMGAIDGHAKNFSIFLLPGGGFHLTPAYDVLSAYTLTAKKQLDPKKISMAMAVRGKNSHYRWAEISGRHWLETAKVCNFPEDEMNAIIKTVLSDMDAVIEKVAGKLPEGFPEKVASPIFEGMRKARRAFKRR